MCLVVEYFCDPLDSSSKCWALMPLPLDLENARKIARDGLADAHELLGAGGFRILDRDGFMVMTETFAEAEPFLNFGR